MKLFKKKIKLPKNYKIFNDYTLTEDECENTKTALYINRELRGVKPRNKSIPLYEEVHIAYEARYIYVDGLRYDLYSAEEVYKIKVKNDTKESFNDDLSYLLIRRVSRDTYKNLTIALVYKTIEFMLNSPRRWLARDYIRVIDYLLLVGEKNLREYYYNKLKKYVPDIEDEDYYIKQNVLETLKNAKQWKNDYIIIPYLGCSCGECVKYEGRVYCISGKDKKFPKIPKQIKRNGIIHQGCHHSIYLCWNPDTEKFRRLRRHEKEDEWVEMTALESSNRSFVDDRNDYEKQFYESWKNELLKHKKDNKNYIKRRLEYNWICENLLEYKPANLSAYTRMKRAKSNSYILLKETAKKLGKELDDDL